MQENVCKNKSQRSTLSRRGFIAATGGLAVTSALVGCGDDTTAVPIPYSTPYSDADVLNFALNLEYLEAEFYLRAATGSGLSTADSGSAGTVTGGAMVPGVTTAQSEYINAIAQDELTHVRFLRQGLQGAAVARPNIDFTNAFTAAAIAAGVITAGQTFNPFDSWTDFLLGAFLFEDVGVTAYTGAAPLLSSAAFLNAAAGIQAVEAYHAGEIRTLIAATASGAGASQTVLTIANKISDLRAALGGGNETHITTGLDATTGLAGTGGSTIVACASVSSTAYARTPSQVLHIVYATGGTTGVAKGGFYPNGLNGTITTTTA